MAAMGNHQNRLRRRHLPFFALVAAAVVGACGFAWLKYGAGLAQGGDSASVHPLQQQGAEVRRGEATVADGDTLVLEGRGVRLFGLDAPEYARRCEMQGADMALGHLSYHALDTLVMGRDVVCYIVEPRPGQTTDVGVCEAGGVELNQWQVRAGWARAWGADSYVRDEGRARMLEAGLWACDEPIEPWNERGPK